MTGGLPIEYPEKICLERSSLKQQPSRIKVHDLNERHFCPREMPTSGIQFGKVQGGVKDRFLEGGLLEGGDLSSGLRK